MEVKHRRKFDLWKRGQKSFKVKAASIEVKVLPDGTGLHECKAALHEEDDDGHDEEEEVVDLFRNLLFRTSFDADADVVVFVDGGV